MKITIVVSSYISTHFSGTDKTSKVHKDSIQSY